MSQSISDSMSDDHLAAGVMPAPGRDKEPASARAVGENLKNAATGEAGKVADQTKEASADVAHAVGDAVSDVADALGGVPSLAGYVRSAAEQTHKFADNLRDQKAGDLLSSAVAWGQKQPVMMLAGAALLGLALSRVVKAGVGPESSPAEGPRAEASDEGRIGVGGGTP
jgi:hypothetical protein